MVRNLALRLLLAGAAITGQGLTWDDEHEPSNRWEAARLRLLIALDLLTGRGDVSMPTVH